MIVKYLRPGLHQLCFIGACVTSLIMHVAVPGGVMAEGKVVLRGAVISPAVECPAIWPELCEPKLRSPLAGIRVNILDAKRKLVRATRTNNRGEFAISVTQGGRYRVEIGAIGFQSRLIRINADKNFGEIIAVPK